MRGHATSPLSCVCDQINTRHCPVHGQGETLRHVGWRNPETDRIWLVPDGFKPAEYDVGPEWEAIYVRR